MEQFYKLKIQIISCLLFISAAVNAQVAATYNFSQTSGSMTGLLGATQMGTTTNDEDSFGPFAIGFNFNFNGTVYTQFSVNTNGYIVFGTAASHSAAVLSDPAGTGTGSINNTVAALCMDIIAQPGSLLWYQLQGNGTNHVLVIEWKNYNMYNAVSGLPGSGNSLNFQIQLFETSNKIQTVYGTMVADTMPYGDPQVGLRGTSNSDFNNRKVGLANMWANSVAGTINSDVCRLSHTLFPASGQTYVWTRTSVGIENTPAPAFSLFDIYPNPSQGILKLSVPDIHFDQCTISIYGTDGKVVYTVKDTNIIGNYSKSISTQGFAKGIYFIKLDTGTGADVKKLVIQ